jgi:hypothetical protein
MIMAFLHRGIPKRMLFRAIEPVETFGHDGEIVKLPAPKFGLVSEQSGKLEPTLDELERQELLTFDPNTDCFTVPLAVRQHIQNKTPDATAWTLRHTVSNLVFHTFPTSSDSGLDL